MEKNCGIFVGKKLYCDNFLVFIWTWTSHLRVFWTMIGFGRSFYISGLDLDHKKWQSAHLWRVERYMVNRHQRPFHRKCRT